jgi:1-pyrroline-5-carboxylate dehydrogenase
MTLYFEHRMSPPLVQGKWKGSSSWNTLLDPLNGEPFIKVAEVDETGIRVCF